MALIFHVDSEGHARPEIRCDSCGGVIEPIDRFMLYVRNNIQLKPNALEEVARSLKAATGD